MNFWDTSAIVPLLVREGDTERREEQLQTADGIIVWWATRVECVSAINRRVREGSISTNGCNAALIRLDALAKQWTVVAPTLDILERAEELLHLYPLRAADAMQLAAALVAARHAPDTRSIHVADTRLSEAAASEGFGVI